MLAEGRDWSEAWERGPQGSGALEGPASFYTERRRGARSQVLTGVDEEEGHVHYTAALSMRSDRGGGTTQRYHQEFSPCQLRPCAESQTSLKGPQLLHQAGCRTCLRGRDVPRPHLPKGGLPLLSRPCSTPPLPNPQRTRAPLAAFTKHSIRAAGAVEPNVLGVTGAAAVTAAAASGWPGQLPAIGCVL